MKHFFDTSALLPVFLEDHMHHEPSLKLFLTANKKQSFCAAHTLAEIYSVVTRLPGKHRLSGEQALLFLDEVSARFSLVSLSGEEYYLAAKAAACGRNCRRHFLRRTSTSAVPRRPKPKSSIPGT